MKLQLLYFAFFLNPFGVFSQVDTCSIYVPNTVTMNCSTGEDYLLIPLSNCEYGKCRFQVFNRWGEVLHDSASLKPFFDGSVYTVGVYVYKLNGEFLNGEKFSITGNFPF